MSREVVLVADNQIQHLYGDPVWLRTGFTNRFVSVAIRSVQLDFFGPDMLRWIVENYGDKRLVLHLGDALNVACSAEWETFLNTMQGAQRGWALAPGNHDAFYFGNGDFSRGDWERACKTGDGEGRPFLKDRFVEAYLMALSSQGAQGVSGFSFSAGDPVAEEGLWEAPAGKNPVVTGVAWRIDRDHPWRSYVVQRLDLRLPGSSEPVVAVLIDTSQYGLRPGLVPIWPWRNSGITGSMGSDQVKVITKWLTGGSGALKIVMGHHPYGSLSGSSQRALDRWREEQGVALYVSAHTHTAQYFVHRADGASWLELNLGSTTDWPPEFRTLAVSTDARFANRVAFRLQRYPLHEIWDEQQIPDCDPAWEVPAERADFYVAYDELVSPDPEETQKALMDTLLRSHAWILRFVASGQGNTVWPEGASSDAAVASAIQKALASKSLDDKLRLLRELGEFARERTVANPALREEFHLCQAQWASKYDLKGRRAPNLADAYIVLPSE